MPSTSSSGCQRNFCHVLAASGNTRKTQPLPAFKASPKTLSQINTGRLSNPVYFFEARLEKSLPALSNAKTNFKKDFQIEFRTALNPCSSAQGRP
jgi:hypothetical protein